MPDAVSPFYLRGAHNRFSFIFFVVVDAERELLQKKVNPKYKVSVVCKEIAFNNVQSDIKCMRLKSMMLQFQRIYRRLLTITCNFPASKYTVQSEIIKKTGKIL